VTASTLSLWLGPLLGLGAGLFVLYWRLKRMAQVPDATLAPAERERAARLLAGGEDTR